MNGSVAKGAFWSVIDKFGQQGISFLVFIVLARFLGPVEYGLASFCFVYLLLAIILLNGLVDGVVSLQLDEPKVLSTLFWLIVGLGLLLSALCYVTAPWVAGLFDEPRLTAVLQLFAVVPLLVALCSVPTILATKEMAFRLLAVRTLSASVAGGVVGVAMAASGAGVFAIVWQQIVLYAVMAVVIWGFTPWRPGLTFSPRLIAAAVRPGLHLTKVYGLGWFDQQLPRLVIGKVVGIGDLGNFAFVMRIRMALQEIFVVSPIVVLFPALSRLRDDTAEQQRMAGDMLITTCLLLFPALALLAGAAGVYVPLVFGDKWSPAVPLLQVYILGTAALPFVYVCRELFRARGMLDRFFRIQVRVTLAGVALLGLLWVPHGLYVFAVGVALLWFAAVPAYLGAARRLLDVDLGAALPVAMRLAVPAALAFVAAIHAADLQLAGHSTLLALSSSVTAGLAVYLIGVLVLVPTVARRAWGNAAVLVSGVFARRA